MVCMFCILSCVRHCGTRTGLGFDSVSSCLCLGLDLVSTHQSLGLI